MRAARPHSTAPRRSQHGSGRSPTSYPEHHPGTSGSRPRRSCSKICRLAIDSSRTRASRLSPVQASRVARRLQLAQSHGASNNIRCCSRARAAVRAHTPGYRVGRCDAGPTKRVNYRLSRTRGERSELSAERGGPGMRHAPCAVVNAGLGFPSSVGRVHRAERRMARGRRELLATNQSGPKQRTKRQRT